MPSGTLRSGVASVLSITIVESTSREKEIRASPGRGWDAACMQLRRKSILLLPAQGCLHTDANVSVALEVPLPGLLG